MILKELKIREINLLKTHQFRLEEYGKAYAEIYKMCKKYAGLRLSEEVLISDMSQKYMQKEKELFDLTHNENHKLHIKAASELYQKSYISFDEVYKILAQYKRLIKFDEAKEILKNTSFYKKIDPKTLMEVIDFIEINGV